MIEIKAPVKNAKYKLIIIKGNPNNNPSTNANLTSPKPMPFPRVKANNRKKNKKDPMAESRCGNKGKLEFKIYKNVETRLVATSRSGIIPYIMSATKMPIKE